MKTVQHIKLLAIILVVTMSNALAASTTNTPAAQNLWFDYQHYAMKPDYLTIMGFTEKANCAISLMRSISVDNDVATLLSNINERTQRSEIFKQVFNDGLMIINKNKALKELSTIEQRDLVFLNLAQHDALLKGIVNIAVTADQQIPSKQEATAKMFNTFYENKNCASLLGYKIKSN